MDEPVNTSLPYYVIIDIADGSVYYKTADVAQAVIVFEKAQTSRHAGHKTLALTALHFIPAAQLAEYTDAVAATSTPRGKTDVAVELTETVTEWNQHELGTREERILAAKRDALVREIESL